MIPCHQVNLYKRSAKRNMARNLNRAQELTRSKKGSLKFEDMISGPLILQKDASKVHMAPEKYIILIRNFQQVVIFVEVIEIQ